VNFDYLISETFRDYLIGVVELVASHGSRCWATTGSTRTVEVKSYSLGRRDAMDGVAVVVDVRLALVLLGRVDVRLVLMAERGVVVLVSVGGQLVFDIASVP
jgi:hypothetical protein